jgi:phage-related minor tail protein
MANDGLDASGNAVSSASDLSQLMRDLDLRAQSLTSSSNALAYAMTRAFTQATVGGKQLDDVFKSLALRISSLALAQAFKPITSGLASAISSGFNGLFGLKAETGAIKPFAAGGVIGAPSYFPLANGGLGLAGEAGPEAIVPLARGSDGRLGIAMSGAAAPANVTVQIATPDAQSFRRSEAYITGQIARAVARGQRSL